jgi:hypothetical protein
LNSIFTEQNSYCGMGHLAQSCGQGRGCCDADGCAAWAASVGFCVAGAPLIVLISSAMGDIKH